MKKALAAILTLALVVGCLTGCGSKAKTAKVIDIDLTQEEYAFGVDKSQPELLEQVNKFIAEIMSNGKFDEICNKYFGDGTPTPVKTSELDPSKDQLVVATNLAFEPFEYMSGENILGIDMEIAEALAAYLGKELVISNMDFDSVCLSVGLQKCDIAMAGLTIKPDREKYVTFTDSYYSASQKLVCMSDCTDFDNCKTAADVENILNAKNKDCKIGVQSGTTGQFYVEGDADWGFTGYQTTCTPYKTASLAIQDLLNGNVQYVIIDSAPAKCITESMNKLQ